jgi:hypothetical protein
MALFKVTVLPPDVGVKTSLQEKISVNEGVKKADGSVNVVLGPIMPRSTTLRTLTPVGVASKEGSKANWTMLKVLPPEVKVPTGVRLNPSPHWGMRGTVVQAAKEPTP